MGAAAPAMPAERPWLRHYGRVPPALGYPATTPYGAVVAASRRAPRAVALEFFGTRITYDALVPLIDRCAAGLAALGLAPGDRLLVAMPTCPQGVIAFYAANRLGAVAAMVHPLSTAPEIAGYLQATGARIAVTLDAFHDRFASLPPGTPLEHLVLARIPDFLTPLRRLAFNLTKGRRIPRVPPDARVRRWRELAGPAVPAAELPGDAPAAILFSGGTTGLPKGVVLSNAAFIASATQVGSWVRLEEGDAILAVLPIFHGFGLAICVNAALVAGGKSILVPTFTASGMAKLIRDARPTFVVGVPTLFEALTRERAFARADLSCLRAAFSGADTLPRAVKERFEAIVAARGGHVRLLEGYGLTEAVSGVMAMPVDEYREGSVGVPLPDMLAAICRPGTVEELAAGEEGEICVSGPTLMTGYLDDAEATSQALRRHADGRVWLHTGDLGRRDADGFFYFTCRLKRMIKSSGFNVYPAQVEAVLLAHPSVRQACVIGVPDAHQVERVRAVVVPEPGVAADGALAKALIAHCRGQLIKWSCPREVRFREALPLTRVGKVDYRALVEEAAREEAR